MNRKVVKNENAAFRCKKIPLTRKELKGLFNFHIPCLCCGLEMLHPDEYTMILDNHLLAGKTGNVIDILKKYEKIMHPVERQVFNMFKSMAVKYPDLDFQQLLLLKKEVHELALVKIQSNIFNKISFYRRILPKKTARALRKLIIKTNDIIFDPEPHKPFSRRIFIHKLKQIVSHINNEKIKEEIITIARRLPRSSDEVCAFVVKNARKKSEIIALNLIHPSVGTFEHLMPKCMNGQNNSLNFALECTHCNNSRHHYPISVQIEENPYMPENAQHHFDKLISLCKKDLCKNEYVENLAKTLNELSDGIIKIELNNC